MLEILTTLIMGKQLYTMLTLFALLLLYLFQFTIPVHINYFNGGCDQFTYSNYYRNNALQTE